MFRTNSTTSAGGLAIEGVSGRARPPSAHRPVTAISAFAPVTDVKWLTFFHININKQISTEERFYVLLGRAGQADTPHIFN